MRHGPVLDEALLLQRHVGLVVPGLLHVDDRLGPGELDRLHRQIGDLVVVAEVLVALLEAGAVDVVGVLRGLLPQPPAHLEVEVGDRGPQIGGRLGIVLRLVGLRAADEAADEDERGEAEERAQAQRAKTGHALGLRGESGAL